MHITIEAGKEIEIKVGSKILVNCTIVGEQESRLIVKVDGYFNGVVIPEIILNDKSLAEKCLRPGEKIFVPCEVVLFHGVKPRVLFQGTLNGNNPTEITLNNNNDILGLIQT